jgi:uroporphyrinogen-III synthase
MNIYTRTERSFSDSEIGLVRIVAGHAALAIHNARLTSGALDMKRMLEARKLIERAKGILQRKHKLTEEDAYLRLRNESRRARRSMSDLASEMVKSEES